MERIPSTQHLYDPKPPKSKYSSSGLVGLVLLWIAAAIVGLEQLSSIVLASQATVNLAVCRSIEALLMGLFFFMTFRGSNLGRLLLIAWLTFAALSGPVTRLMLNGPVPPETRPLLLLMHTMPVFAAIAYGVCVILVLTPMVSDYIKEC